MLYAGIFKKTLEQISIHSGSFTNRASSSPLSARIFPEINRTCNKQATHFGISCLMANLTAAEQTKTLKEGERVLAPTRRPDGTLRKSIRIRAGYVPQDEVAVYKSRGALLKEKSELMESVPPGYDPEGNDVVNKVKSKSAKRNERKKEKRLQASNDEEKTGVSSNEDLVRASEPLESVVSQMNEIAISGNPAVASPPLNAIEGPVTGDHVPDIDKRIRALKKKIRLTEAQKTGNDLKPEQLEKIAKLDEWRNELKLLEDKKASLEAV